jgi:ATP-dependent DNA helicase RecQ
LEPQNTEPAIVVIYNLIARGLPTRLSSFSEDFFSKTFAFTQKQIDSKGNIEWKFLKNNIYELIFKSLHIISPSDKDDIFTFSDSKRDRFNKEIISKLIIPKLGYHFLQSIRQNITYSDLASLDFEFLQNPNSNILNEFSTDKADFVIYFPYPYNGIKGIIIETNPDAGETGTDFINLNKKKLLAESLKFDFIYAKNGKIENAVSQLQKYAYIEPFEILKKNYQTPIFAGESGRDAMQAALSPFGTARIQALTLKFILAGKLDLKAEKWDIAVIERDVPAAFAAFEDLKNYFRNLNTLCESEIKIPEIKLTIFYSEDFAQAKLNSTFKGEKIRISQFKSETEFDLLIDFSILGRSFNPEKKIQNASRNFAAIRSCITRTANRKFEFSNPLKYKTIDELTPEIKDASEFFLQSIFRKEKFFDEQISALKYILNPKSSIIISPPATGKSLLWQFAAILQTGITVAAFPLSSIIDEQFKKLRNEHIDGCFYINSSNQKLYQKQKVIQQIIDGQAQILLLSPEILNDKVFRELTSEMQNRNFSFAGLAIEESHCLSEWSHDFRTSFSNFGKSARRLLKTQENQEISITAFSSGASYDVRKDISEIFGIEENSCWICNQNRLRHHPKIVITKEGPRTRDLEMALSISLQNKLNELASILKTLNFTTDKTLIFANNQSDLKKITDLCKSLFPNLKIGLFSGVSDNESNPVSGIEFEISQKNYNEFNEGKNRLLISDESAGIGLDMREVKNIVFFNIPNSPESFVQLSGRAGRDGTDAFIYMIFDKTSLSFNENIEIQKSNGETETIEQATDTVPDTVIVRKKVKQKYQGRKKELILTNELLTQINFPKSTPNELITRKITESFNENVILAAQPVENPYQITVQKGNKSYGNINYKTNSVDIQQTDFEKKISFSILNFVKTEIEKSFTSPNEIFEKLNKNIEFTEYEGIETILNKIQIGEESQTEFFLYNGIAEEILEILTKNISENFKLKYLIQELENNTHHVKFIEKLNKIADTNIVTKEIDVPILLADLFYKYRNENQTLMLLHRLLLLQIIDDFEIDSTRCSVKVFFRKKENETYRISLFHFLKNFISAEKAMELFNTFDSSGETDVIRKCTDFLINSIYNFVFEKRIDTIDEITEFYKAVAQNKSTQKSLDLKTSNYFTHQNSAKYLNTLIIPSLQIGTFNLKISSFDTVMKYIALAKDLLDTRDHIKESTEILLKENEKNYTVLLLNAYTVLWAGFKNEKIFEKSYNKMTEGFMLMQENEKLEYSELSKRRTQFLNELYHRDSELQKIIEPLINIKTHTNWLINFNKSFLEGFQVSR